MDLLGVQQKHDKRIAHPTSRTSHFLARAFAFFKRIIMLIVHIDHNLLPLRMVSGSRLPFVVDYLAFHEWIPQGYDKNMISASPPPALLTSYPRLRLSPCISLCSFYIFDSRLRTSLCSFACPRWSHGRSFFALYQRHA